MAFTDEDGSGSIELKEFIMVLSRYTAAARTEKLKFAFMMFDEARKHVCSLKRFDMLLIRLLR